MSETSGEVTDEFRNKMSEWVTIKKTLVEARKDVKVLNQKEKELKTFIMGFMQKEGIDNVNLKKGKVSLRNSNKRETLTKDRVQSGQSRLQRDVRSLLLAAKALSGQ